MQDHLEEEDRQAQRMEAVGHLAIALAQDFNNLLTIISGYSEILLSRIRADDSMQESLNAICDAGTRAAALTRHLLAFGQQSKLEPRVLDANDVVRATEDILRRLLGDHIHLTTRLSPQTSRIQVDAGQLEQVLITLAVNARSAMPDGGTLTVETRDVTLTGKDTITHPEVRAGKYFMLAVADTGKGMTDEPTTHLCQPFNTTKGFSNGTMQRLSVVQDIITQSRGHIEVHSDPNVGTTFNLFFPPVTRGVSAAESGSRKQDVRGCERILLVEDEEAVRAFALRALETNGYKALAVCNGKMALHSLENFSGTFDILVTDVEMPGMGGRELAEALRTRFPTMRVLFTSGCTEDQLAKYGVVTAAVGFLRKPYSPLALARKVRQVLETK